VFSSDNIFILGVGAGKLALAEFNARPGQPPVLLRHAIGEMGITPESETDATAHISAEFARMSAELGMRGGATVWVALSGQVVFPRFVKLPPVSKDKLQTMIQYEAEQNVPFPISELVWDYSLIGGGESGEQYAMIVAAKNESVTAVTDCVTRAGFEPRVVDVSPMGL
jgi:Tfp pilus assembly PilM family ATPase